MNFLERSDAVLMKQAVDDIQRQAAIERLTKTRRWYFWNATVLLAGFLIVLLSAGLSDRNLTPRIIVALFLLGVCVVLQVIPFMKLDADLRLLKLVDKLKR